MTIQVKQGHCVDVMRGMGPRSVHSITCSPPYFRARRYGGEPQVWPDPGGTPLCVDGDHEWGEYVTPGVDGGRNSAKLAIKGTDNFQVTTASVDAACARCRSWRGELGWEPTVALYIHHLVQVFRAARRVLRDDGMLFVNISGGYANEAGGQNGSSGGVSAKAVSANRQAGRTDKTGGLPPLNWIDVPGMLGAAMQADGWIWRSYVHLVKRSPLPESVSSWRWERCRIRVQRSGRGTNPAMAAYPAGRQSSTLAATSAHQGSPSREAALEAMAQWADCPGCPKCEKTDNLVLRRGAWRPTRATEALLLFVKGERYWSDQDAVRVPASVSDLAWKRTSQNGQGSGELAKSVRLGGGASGRNAWDWMEWPVSQFAGNHFASFSPDLAAFCIKAAVPERCCPVCGAGYARVIERGLPNPERPQAARALELARQKGLTAGHLAAIRATGVTDTGKAQVTQNGTGRNTAEVQRLAAEAKQALGGYFREFLWGENRTTSWRPTCACKDAGPPVAGTVLDPFSGAGSTLIAADRLGRHGIGIDLNDSYVDLSETRIDVERAEATGGGMDRNGRVWEVLALPLSAD